MKPYCLNDINVSYIILKKLTNEKENRYPCVTYYPKAVHDPLVTLLGIQVHDMNNKRKAEIYDSPMQLLPVAHHL